MPENWPLKSDYNSNESLKHGQKLEGEGGVGVWLENVKETNFFHWGGSEVNKKLVQGEEMYAQRVKGIIIHLR